MLEISEDDIRARLRIDNGWWLGRTAGGTALPPHKRDYFTPFYELATQTLPVRAVVLMGPRRIGKTVMLLQAIAGLVASGTPPEQILYASLDTPLYSGLPLERLLAIYLAGVGPDQGKRIHVFFDEVQFLKNWEQHLKSLVDSYPRIKFVVSGSAAAALKLKSNESGAGRFTDFTLPPLTFAEFLRLTGLETALIDSRANEFAARDIEKLNAAFVRYLNFGGYPELALSAKAQDDPGRYLQADIIDKVLLRDLPSLYGIGDVQELNALFTHLAFNTANEVSLDKLARNSNVAKNTIKKYLEYLEAAYLIRRIERVDRNASRFQRAAAFKIHLANPSLRTALFGPLLADDPKFGFAAETAVVAQWMHTPDFTSRLKYARWDDKEIDLVYLDSTLQKAKWAVEVKWSNRHGERPEEIEGLFEFAKLQPSLSRPVATSRTVAGTLRAYGGEVTLEPTALYCYKAGKNIAGRAP